MVSIGVLYLSMNALPDTASAFLPIVFGVTHLSPVLVVLFVLSVSSKVTMKNQTNQSNSTPISIAQVRRLLAVGTNYKAAYIGELNMRVIGNTGVTDLVKPEDERIAGRRVLKQSTYEMISAITSGPKEGRETGLTWQGMKARLENNRIILTLNETHTVNDQDKPYSKDFLAIWFELPVKKQYISNDTGDIKTVTGILQTTDPLRVGEMMDAREISTISPNIIWHDEDPTNQDEGDWEYVDWSFEFDHEVAENLP